jgi:hypothetical protein
VRRDETNAGADLVAPDRWQAKPLSVSIMQLPIRGVSVTERRSSTVPD